MNEEVNTVLVTARNHQVVSEMTGMTLFDVHRAYRDAIEDGEVCILEVKHGLVYNVFDQKSTDE